MGPRNAKFYSGEQLILKLIAATQRDATRHEMEDHPAVREDIHNHYIDMRRAILELMGPVKFKCTKEFRRKYYPMLLTKGDSNVSARLLGRVFQRPILHCRG